MTCGTAAEAKLILVGHRGASVTAPENTLAAFNRAKAFADFVEFDVRSTNDGHLVVMHDATVERTTNGKGAVADFTFAQLRALDAGSWFKPEFAGEKIPSAEEAITAIQSEAAPFMERKTGTVAQFIALLQRNPLRPEGIVMSFDYEFVVALKKAKPELHVGWVGAGVLHPSQIAQAIVDGVSHFIWANGDITPVMVNAIHQAGGLVFGWTINDLATTSALSDFGIDGIITSRADEFAGSPLFSAAVSTDQFQPPNRLIVRLGRSAVLGTSVSGHAARSVAWSRVEETNVVATGSRFVFKADSASSYGRYRASWSENGRTLAHEYDVVPGVTDNQLVNISARMTMGAGEATGIVGFVVKSETAPRFLLRAVGPSLAGFGVTDPVTQPTLTLFRRGSVIDSELSPTRTSAEGADFIRNGAFPLASASGDVAIMKNLEGGAYSVHLSCKTGKPGVGLIEVYQDNTAANWSLGSPMNISLRGRALPESPLIAGFVVPAGNSQTILVRGIGPALARFGIVEPLRDPKLRIYDAKHCIVAENDEWWTDGESSLVEKVASQVGAFPISAGREAAILVTLAPGAYSALLTDASGNRSGVGLLEIYAVNTELDALDSLER